MRILGVEAIYPRKRLTFPDEDRLYVMTNEIRKKSGEYTVDIFNSEGLFIGRKGIISSGTIKAKNNRLYCLREKESGYKELVVYKMMWE